MGEPRNQGTEYSYSLPIIEEPDRDITQIRNLARGALHLVKAGIMLLLKIFH